MRPPGERLGQRRVAATILHMHAVPGRRDVNGETHAEAQLRARMRVRLRVRVGATVAHLLPKGQLVPADVLPRPKVPKLLGCLHQDSGPVNPENRPGAS